MTIDETREYRSFIVYASNKLIQNSAFDLTEQQLKLMDFVIVKIKEQDTEFCDYEFNLSDICDVFGIQKQSINYNRLMNSLQDLRNKSFWIKEESKLKLCSWVNKVVIDKATKKVTIRIDDDLKPYLLQLSENYTSYELANTLVLESKHSIKLYKFLSSYKKMRQVQFDVETIKKQLNCESKYKEFKYFNNQALMPAIEELNKKTNLTVKVTYKRESRAVKYIQFDISEKHGNDRFEMMVERERILENE